MKWGIFTFDSSDNKILFAPTKLSITNCLGYSRVNVATNGGHTVNMFAKQNGFVAIKCRKDLDAIDKTIVRRRVRTPLTSNRGLREKFQIY